MRNNSNGYTISIVVLSVLLTIALIVGSTFAWFMDQSDQIRRIIILGDPVNLSFVTPQGNKLGDSESLPIRIYGNTLLPGMKADVYASARFDKSNTEALLRAKLEVTVEGGTASEEKVMQVTESITTSLANIISNEWVYYSGWWYYIGTNDQETPVERTRMKNINSESDVDIERTIHFINASFNFPIIVDNTFSRSIVTFKITFQGLQAYLPAYLEKEKEGENEGIYRINRIANVIDIFNSL